MRYKKYLDKPEQATKGLTTATRIMDAAKRLFYSKGFKATTTRDIAAEADVALGLIPYYFKTKENLAHKVAYDQLNQFYRQFDCEEITSLTSAEKMFALNLMIYDRMFSDPVFGNLLFELTATTEIMDEPSEVFLELSEQIIKEYNITVTENDNKAYLAVLMGGQKNLIQRYWRNTLDISYTQITNILLSNYFYNLGFSDQEIAKIIKNAQDYYHTIKMEREKEIRKN